MAIGSIPGLALPVAFAETVPPSLRGSREWVLEATIRYIKPVGGPAGREGLIIGCEDGTVVKIFIDNTFFVPLVKHRASVRSLDLSIQRDKLAVVDEHSAITVYELVTGALLFEEQNAEVAPRSAMLLSYARFRLRHLHRALVTLFRTRPNAWCLGRAFVVP